MRGQRHAPAALYPRERPGTHCTEAEWVPGPVSTVAENLAPTGIRSPDSPASSQSLYRLRYPAYFSPHSILKFQPLGISFTQPPKTYYAQEIQIWLKAHQNRVVTRYQISRLVGKAYLNSATVVIAANGFRKTGLYPASVTYLMYMIMEAYLSATSRVACLTTLCHVTELQKNRLPLAAQIHRP